MVASLLESYRIPFPPQEDTQVSTSNLLLKILAVITVRLPVTVWRTLRYSLGKVCLDVPSCNCEHTELNYLGEAFANIGQVTGWFAHSIQVCTGTFLSIRSTSFQISPP
jgi:hypothetical protein